MAPRRTIGCLLVAVLALLAVPPAAEAGDAAETPELHAWRAGLWLAETAMVATEEWTGDEFSQGEAVSRVYRRACDHANALGESLPALPPFDGERKTAERYFLDHDIPRWLAAVRTKHGGQVAALAEFQLKGILTGAMLGASREDVFLGALRAAPHTGLPLELVLAPFASDVERGWAWLGEWRRSLAPDGEVLLARPLTRVSAPPAYATVWDYGARLARAALAHRDGTLTDDMLDGLRGSAQAVQAVEPDFGTTPSVGRLLARTEHRFALLHGLATVRVFRLASFGARVAFVLGADDPAAIALDLAWQAEGVPERVWAPAAEAIGAAADLDGVRAAIATFEAEGASRLDGEPALDPDADDRQRGQVWWLGCVLSESLLAVPTDAFGEADVALRHRAAQQLAARLGLVARLAPASGVSESRAQLIEWIRVGGGQAVAAEIGTEVGERDAAVFNLAVRAQLLARLYEPRGVRGTKLAATIERLSAEIGVADVWTAVLEAVGEGAPREGVERAIDTAIDATGARWLPREWFY